MSLPSEPQGRPGLALLAAREAGYSALTVIVCIVLWAFTDASGNFWPRWVIFVVVLGFITRVGKAALGDVKERETLERRHSGTR